MKGSGGSCSGPGGGREAQAAWRRLSIAVGGNLSLLHGRARGSGLLAVAYPHSGLVMAKVVFRHLLKISVSTYCFFS